MARRNLSWERQLWDQATRPKYRGWTGLVAIVLLLAADRGGTAVLGAAADLWWCLAGVPTVCGARRSSGGTCKANAKGLVVGCAT